MKYEGNVLAWVRQSSDSQHSIDSQISAFRAFCEGHSFKQVHILSFVGSAMSNDPTTFFDDMRGQGITAYDDYKRLLDANQIDFVWAISPSRYGRSKWLYNYMVQYAIDNGATVYAEGAGVINEANFDAMVALTSIGSQADVKRLHGWRAIQTRIENMKRGIPTKGQPWTHEALRDDKGKLTGVQIKDDARLPVQIATKYLLEGKSYREISTLMTNAGYKHFAAHHHVRRLFWNPILHGNLGYGHQRKSHTFVLEETVDIPDGVVMVYDVIEPIWDSETHKLVKAELRHRIAMNGGRNSRSETKNPFLGLVKCGQCGANLNYWYVNNKYEYLRCYARCGAKVTRLDWMINYVDELLQLAIEHGFMSIVDDTQDSDLWQKQIESMTQQIAKTDNLINEYLRLEVERPDMSHRYGQLIQEENSKLKMLRTELVSLQRAKPVNPAISQMAMDTIKAKGKLLWEMPRGEILGILRDLFANRRLYVLDYEVEIRHT